MTTARLSTVRWALAFLLACGLRTGAQTSTEPSRELVEMSLEALVDMGFWGLELKDRKNLSPQLHALGSITYQESDEDAGVKSGAPCDGQTWLGIRAGTFVGRLVLYVFFDPLLGFGGGRSQHWKQR